MFPALFGDLPYYFSCYRNRSSQLLPAVLRFSESFTGGSQTHVGLVQIRWRMVKTTTTKKGWGLIGSCKECSSVYTHVGRCSWNSNQVLVSSASPQQESPSSLNSFLLPLRSLHSTRKQTIRKWAGKWKEGEFLGQKVKNCRSLRKFSMFPNTNVRSHPKILESFCKLYSFFLQYIAQLILPSILPSSYADAWTLVLHTALDSGPTKLPWWKTCEIGSTCVPPTRWAQQHISFRQTAGCCSTPRRGRQHSSSSY